MIVALVGNQNCGKTTLYNRLTGAGQHVGNWPGVTVAGHSADLLPLWQRSCSCPIRVVDLPGTYSLSAFSRDEDVTRRFLLETPPDVILNVVDTVHLERNLYLTLQLLSLGIPVVVALNMLDSLHAGGGQADPSVLAGKLKVPVVPLCARNGQGIGSLLKAITAAKPPSCPLFFCGAAGKALETLTHLLPRHRYAIFAFGGAEALSGLVAEETQQQTAVVLQKLEEATGVPPAETLATDGYHCLQTLLQGCWKPGRMPAGAIRTDGLLLSSRLAVPIFIGVMLLVFWLAFGLPGSFLTGLLAGRTAQLTAAAKLWLANTRAAPWLAALLTEGILPGVESVIGFLPALLLMLLMMDLLEDSGYLTRAAFLMDRPLRCVGLSGRSLFSLTLGFGCTVPAVLSARGIRSERERRLVILLAPLMSCSAKLPVYALLAQAFFPRFAAGVIATLYLAGIALAVLVGWLSARQEQQGLNAFLLELPPLRIPSAGNALRQTVKHCREFLGRVLSLVVLCSVLVWLLSNLSPRLVPVETLEESLLGQLAGLLSPLLAPCGFGSREAAAALITGLMAKESIISTLAVLAGSRGAAGVFASPLAAFSFLLFVLLYPPCVAASQMIREELNGAGSAFRWEAGRLLAAWGISMLVFQTGTLLGLG